MARRERREMNNESIKDMFEMFDAGMRTKEIEELTGRSRSLISRYKKKWMDELKTSSNKKDETIVEEKTEDESAGLANSEYAKAYLAGDPSVLPMIRSNFEIERTVKIRSKKTSILYEMDPSLEKKILKITLADGQQIELELGLFERFVDEGIDVYLEMKRTA